MVRNPLSNRALTHIIRVVSLLLKQRAWRLSTSTQGHDNFTNLILFSLIKSGLHIKQARMKVTHKIILSNLHIKQARMKVTHKIILSNLCLITILGATSHRYYNSCFKVLLSKTQHLHNKTHITCTHIYTHTYICILFTWGQFHLRFGCILKLLAHTQYLYHF